MAINTLYSLFTSCCRGKNHPSDEEQYLCNYWTLAAHNSLTFGHMLRAEIEIKQALSFDPQEKVALEVNRLVQETLEIKVAALEAFEKGDYGRTRQLCSIILKRFPLNLSVKQFQNLLPRPVSFP